MVRALISIEDKQLSRLDRLAQKNKRSRAELVREAINQYLAQKDKEPTWEEIVEKTAGIWKYKNIDALEYQRRLREEWGR